MAYWLFKTEPNEFSIDDLKSRKQERWNGIRNYQARNFMRDDIKKGDQVFIYHSSCKKIGVVGVAQVVKEAYIDPAQFDKKNKYYDEKATQEKPRWFCVDVKFVEKFEDILSLADIKNKKSLSEMTLVKRGRLSIQPVLKKEWDIVMNLAG